MNVFHWHLSEDQGFRAESKIYPLLTGKGSNGLYYTQAQMREVVEYARERGIRVVPEFDMPCHTTAWFVGYPDLASGKGPYKIETHWGVFDPAMDPTRESTFEFIGKFIGEMTTIFPDAYFHVGGDECNGKEWDANPRIKAFMRAHGLKDNAALQSYFTARVQKLVAAHHRIMEGWDEVLAARYSEGCSDSVVARTEVSGRGSAAGQSRIAFDGLLRRSESVGSRALSGRPAGRRRREPDTGGKKARAGRRSGDVERIRDSGDYRQPHLAAHGGNRGTAVVCAGCARCEFDVCADGCCLKQTGGIRTEAPVVYPADAAAHERPVRSEISCGAGQRSCSRRWDINGRS